MELLEWQKNWINTNSENSSPKPKFHIKIAVKVLKVLQIIWGSLRPPFMKSVCRFYPTCSEYTILAVQKYGVIKGLYKGIKRVLRCHPPNGGVDFP